MEKYKNKGLTGLGNLGNTCYLNSVTQIFSNIHEFSEFLDNVSHLNKNLDSILLNEYNDLRKLIWNKNVTIIPKKYLSILFKVNKKRNLDDFVGYNQNDFMEFYDLLMNSFHKSLRNIKIYNYDYINDFSNENDDKKYINFLNIVFKNDYSIINNIFSGIYEIRLKSKDNKKIVSKSYDLFNSMSLGFKKDCTVLELFNEHFKPELLNGEDQWYNDETKQKEDVIKETCIKKFPKILCLHLKRFTNNLKKIRFNVNFDLILNINKNKYELFGLVMHSGTFDGGHYYVIIKNENEKWYNFNDTNVNNCNINNINKSQIYCLFYRLKE